MKFPPILHVTIDSEGTDDEFLIAHDNGIFGPAVAGEKIRCALYKLVEVGNVTANPVYTKGKQ